MTTWHREYELVPRGSLAAFKRRSPPLELLQPTFSSASALVRQLAASQSLHTLRKTLAAEQPGTDIGRLDDSEVLELLAHRIVARRVLVFRRPQRAVVIPDIEEEVADQPVERDVLTSIRIVVVEDKTYKPIAGVKLKLTLPGGAQEVATTGDDGSVERSNLRGGGVDVTSPLDGATLANTFEFVALDWGEPPSPIDEEPIAGAEGRRFASLIQRHKVRTHDTLESVAESFGLTWQQLAELNWETSEPKEVNRRLRTSVGCKKRTKDRKNYVFDDADDPGLLYALSVWSQRSLSTDRTYTLRLRIPVIPKPKKKMFLFSI